MRAIRIDFAPSSIRRSVYNTPFLVSLLCSAGLVLGVGAAVAISHVLAQQAAREAQIRMATVGTMVEVTHMKHAPIPEMQASAVNAAVLQLNLPWREVREAIETATPPEVALLALEPDPKTRTLRITAEAKSSDAMLTYIEQLKQQPFFISAELSKHEINELDPNKPLRFQLDVQWARQGVTP